MMEDQLIEEKTPVYSGRFGEDEPSAYPEAPEVAVDDDQLESSKLHIPISIPSEIDDEEINELIAASEEDFLDFELNDFDSDNQNVVSSQEALIDEASSEEAFLAETNRFSFLSGLKKTPVLEDAQGRSYILDHFPFVLGRDRDSDLQLSAGGVSRHHAEIIEELGRWVIRDLGSLNGTLVNDYRVDRVIVESGDQIKIGKATLLFKLQENLPETKGFDKNREKHEQIHLDHPETLLPEFLPNKTSVSLIEQHRWMVWLFALIPLLVILIAAYFIFDTQSVESAPFHTPSYINTTVSNIMDDVSSNSTDVLGSHSYQDGFEEGNTQTEAFSLSQYSAMKTEIEQNDQDLVALDSVAPEIFDQILELNSAELPNNTGNSLNNNSFNNNSLNNENLKNIAIKSVENDFEAMDMSTALVKESVKPKEMQIIPAAQVIPDSRPQAIEQNTASQKSPQQISQQVSKAKVSEDQKQQVTRLLESVGERYAAGQMNEWMSEVDQWLQVKMLDRHLRAELKVKKSELENRLQAFYLGQDSIKKGDKAAAFDAWIKFLVSEKKSGREKKSFYYNYVVRQVGDTYIEKAKAAQDNQNFSSAYIYWSKAAKFANIETAKKQVALIDRGAKEAYQEAVSLAENDQIQEAQGMWKQIIQTLPKNHALHTKAAAKLAWSYAYRKKSASEG